MMPSAVRLVVRGYDAVVTLMALIAAGMLVWLMVSILISVTMRNIGLQPMAWLFTSSEYALLYMTMLGAPWLVRRKGHVHIELVTAGLPPRWRRALSRAVALGCVAVCGVLTWKGIDLVQLNITRADFDVRAYYFPRWLLTIAFPVSFGLMAVEFARFTFGRDLLHSGEAGIHE
jgi:TRAP-type C4-dicarboxylate transport system permease small subunit